MKHLITLFILVFALPAFSEAPKPLQEAVNAYLKDGRSVFLPTLLKGSPIEGEKAVLAQESMIAQVESYYGKPESWEVLSICQLTDRVRTTYYIINFERGPVYGYVDTYKLKSGKEVTSKFLFNTDASKILPYHPILKENFCGQ